MKYVKWTLIGLVICGMLSFAVFKLAVVLFTSVSGAVITLIGVLGLVHHLAISNNVPLDRIAEWLSRLGRSLIIEFVPKHDSQVTRLLATREDIFTHYHEDAFRRAMGSRFRIEDRQPIPGTDRALYLMRKM